jgi:hypothetical protein
VQWAVHELRLCSAGRTFGQHISAAVCPAAAAGTLIAAACITEGGITGKAPAAAAAVVASSQLLDLCLVLFTAEVYGLSLQLWSLLVGLLAATPLVQLLSDATACSATCLADSVQQQLRC